MRWIASGGLVTAVLALGGCTGSEPPPQRQAEPIPACEPYRGNITEFGRCRLFASGLGADLIPEAGRTASLDAQIRCATLRNSPGPYGACIETVEREARLAAAQEPDEPAAAADADTADAADTGDDVDAFAQLLDALAGLDEPDALEPRVGVGVE